MTRGMDDIDCDESVYGRHEQTVWKPGDKESNKYRGAGTQTAVLTPHESSMVDDAGGMQTTTDLTRRARELGHGELSTSLPVTDQKFRSGFNSRSPFSTGRTTPSSWKPPDDDRPCRRGSP